MVRPGSTSPKPAGFSINIVVRLLCGFSAPSSVLTRTATKVEEPPLVSHIFWPVIT